ncbi:hypothetical protein B6U83_05245 [Thermoplasmatales archaeon ex4484_36]|nr:MAG: hypothetical protein B6U83_05245 [Thermoplasmatales archaeon ex4484_36]
MKLFSKKKVEFRTINSDDEARIFNSLEDGGWVMIGDPYTFEERSRNLKKARKFAMMEAEERGAELLIESYDPYLSHLPHMGLTYSAWRRATPEELKKRIEMKRLEEERRKAEMAAKGELPAERVVEVNVESVEAEAIASGSAEEEPDMFEAQGIEAVSVEVNPYDIAEKEYEETLKSYERLEVEEVETEKVTEEPELTSAPAPELLEEAPPSPPSGPPGSPGEEATEGESVVAGSREEAGEAEKEGEGGE